MADEPTIGRAAGAEEGSRKAHGRFTEGSRKAHGRYIEGSKKVRGGLKEGSWRVPELLALNTAHAAAMRDCSSRART
jgi:hypothetical protein